MIEAIYMAHDINQTIIEFIEKIVAEVGKEKHTYESCAIPAECLKQLRKLFLQKKWKLLYLQTISRQEKKY